MNKFLILKIGGKQYKVSEGDEILVDKIADPKIKPDILLYSDGNVVNIGKPFLKNASVELKILSEDEKGKKVDVFKYKAKSRYRKHVGFRPKFTRIRVEKVTSSK